MFTKPATPSATATSRFEKRSSSRRSRASRGVAPLREAGVQIERVRHDRRADDAHRERERRAVAQLRHDEMVCGRVPVLRRDQQFAEVARADHADQRRDRGLERPEAALFQREDRAGQHRRRGHPGDERQMQQQAERERPTQEFGEIGRHRGDLGRRPHPPDDGPRKMLAAQLGEVAARHDAELRRHRLKHHRDHVRGEHDPQQLVAVRGARLDVGREVAGVHVADRRDHGRPDERQRGRDALAAPFERVARGADGARARVSRRREIAGGSAHRG